MGLLDRWRSENPTAPPTDKPPRGASGRAHTAGFLDFEEFNQDLVHPRGQDIYDKMYRTDGDVRQVVQLVCNPMTSGTWAVQPYGGEVAKEEDIKVADFVRWALWECMKPNLIGHLIEFMPVLIRGGFAPGEVTWMSVEYEGDLKVVPRSIGLRLPKTIEQFEQDRYGRLTRIKQFLPVPIATMIRREGSTDNQRAEGDNYRWLDAKNLVYYRIGAEGDNWEGVSMLRPAYKHWLFKDKIERIDAIAQEREAVGIPICYPPTGATTEQLDEMEEILAGMRTNEQGYIVAPGPKAGAGAPDGTGWLIEVIGYDRTGSGRDPQPSLKYHTDKVSAAFISEFMRLGHSNVGARATAEVQADPFLMSIEALVTVVETALNDELVVPLVAHNFANVKNLPRLKMSLVDSTSLAQLADFVLKLIQGGALFPDQELEDFLRARADLPPANPEAVKERGKKDSELRRDVISGGGDPYGQNDKPGTQHGNKDAPGKSSGKGGAGKGTAQRDSIDNDGVTLAVAVESYGDAEYEYGPLRWWEMIVDLDGLDSTFRMMGDDFKATCGDHVYEMAKAMANPVSPLGDMDDDYGARLDSAIHSRLAAMYDYGHHSVREEAMRQVELATSLDRGASDRGGALKERARLAADRVVLEMRQAMLGNDLAHGDIANAQVAAETAGLAALARAGYDHGTAAVLHGRHDMGVQLAQEDNGLDVVGVRYSAVLDRNTCAACRSADDGQVRDFNDPVRLARRPPNPTCYSTASGHNRCRCFEVYEVLPSGTDLPAPSEGRTLDGDVDMPPFVIDVATRLVDRGLSVDRAIGIAEQVARTYCRTGNMPWPGLRGMGLERSAACDAAWRST